MAGGEPKQYAAFLSHYKVETGTESRLVAGELGRLLPPGHNSCFLDSDDVKDHCDLADRVWAPRAQTHRHPWHHAQTTLPGPL